MDQQSIRNRSCKRRTKHKSRPSKDTQLCVSQKIPANRQSEKIPATQKEIDKAREEATQKATPSRQSGNQGTEFGLIANHPKWLKPPAVDNRLDENSLFLYSKLRYYRTRTTLVKINHKKRKKVRKEK